MGEKICPILIKREIKIYFYIGPNFFQQHFLPNMAGYSWVVKTPDIGLVSYSIISLRLQYSYAIMHAAWFWHFYCYLSYSSASWCMALKWLLLPPILLCQLLHGSEIVTLTSNIPLLADAWLCHGYSYLQYSSASCCMVIAWLAGDFSWTSYLKFSCTRTLICRGRH